MKSCLLLFGLIFAFALPVRAAEPAPVGDDFVAYMKQVLNPSNLGMRQARFYPYLRPEGRRIGYGHPVIDKTLYEKGWSQEEADQHLRDDIAAAARDLGAFLAAHEPDHPYGKLDPTARDILLDFAVTEGAKNIRPEVYRAVLAHDWAKFISGYLYVRGATGWPDILKNHAFAQRWIYGPNPLVPLPAKTPSMVPLLPETAP